MTGGSIILSVLTLSVGLTALANPPEPSVARRPYADVRGFNFQPPWGSNGRDIWMKFDGTEYRRIIRLAKKAFPKMNTLRVWLSYDARYENREKCLTNVQEAATIIRSEGLRMVPVYFNNWHSCCPDFGGLCVEQIAFARQRDWQPFRRYLHEVAAALEPTGAVLVSDLCNEPLNNADVGKIRDFLLAMSAEIRKVSKAPVTIGTQGMRSDQGKTDLEHFAEAVDVFTIHPYSVCMAPKEGHLKHVQWLVAEADRLGKPIFVSECCWDDTGDKARGDIVELELANYEKAGIGFIVHALSPSPVADLHPKSDMNIGFDMHFMRLDGSIRPHHDAFNRH